MKTYPSHPGRATACLITFAFSIFSVSVFAQPVCSNPNTLFGLDGSGKIYKIDPVTASSGAAINTASYTSALSYTTIGAGQTSAPSISNAIGYNNFNGMFYYFKRDPGGSGSQFVSYDPVMDKYATLASPPMSVSVHSGCVSFSGNGYYCLDVSSNLYYYDILLNTWTLITFSFTDQSANNVSTIFQSMSTGDMAIDGNGNLWILPSNGTNYALYEIVAPLPTTPVSSIVVKQQIPPTTATPSGKSIYGIAFDALGNIYFSTSANELYKLSSVSGSPVLTGTIPASGITDLSSCSFPLTVLAVRWTGFSAIAKNGNSVELNWQVADQGLSGAFIIERSTDQQNWQQIGSLPITMGRNDFHYSDDQPEQGNNYYRIRLTDNHNYTTWSPTREINLRNTSMVKVWPNPVKDVLYININSGADAGNENYSIGYDLSGHTLFRQVLHEGLNIVDMKPVPKGMYQVMIHSRGGALQRKKVIKE